MAHSGLPVPAGEAEIPFLREILVDIGDHQSITRHLSTFSAHVSRISEIVASYRPPCLLLLDELGRGTDPAYGAPLAVAIIEHLRDHEVLMIVTTHHRGLKAYAASTAGVQNASVRLDPETNRPTYEVEVGVAGSSSGLEIAQQLGLSAQIVHRARELLDQKDLAAEQYLQDLRAELRHVRTRREEFLRKRAQLDAERLSLRKEFDGRKRTLEKEFEKRLKKWGDEFRAHGSKFLKRLGDRSEANRARKEMLRREAALKEEFRRRLHTVSSEDKSLEVSPPDFREGDEVYHRFFRKRGTLIARDGEEAEVEIDGKRITAELDQLTRVESKRVSRELSKRVQIEVVEETNPELNLIGQTVDEALEAVDKFLDRAFVSNLDEVRLIHGFGTGRLKKSVAEFLNTHPQVQDYDVEGGATKVTLKS
jgi:DNA mismatch repair protein MutS2